jgi:hypothetical protein
MTSVIQSLARTSGWAVNVGVNAMNETAGRHHICVWLASVHQTSHIGNRAVAILAWPKVYFVWPTAVEAVVRTELVG